MSVRGPVRSGRSFHFVGLTSRSCRQLTLGSFSEPQNGFDYAVVSTARPSGILKIGKEIENRFRSSTLKRSAIYQSSSFPASARLTRDTLLPFVEIRTFAILTVPVLRRHSGFSTSSRNSGNSCQNVSRGVRTHFAKFPIEDCTILIEYAGVTPTQATGSLKSELVENRRKLDAARDRAARCSARVTGVPLCASLRDPLPAC